MFRFILAAILLIGSPLVSQAQECGPTQQSIGWTQPNNVAIADDNAIRWPTDASMRIAYSGPWCPNIDQVELVDEEGNAVPAQIRIKTPFKLVTNERDALTILEIDPVEELAPRTDYTLTVRPPEPSLPLYREYILEFRTRGGPANEMPDFEGVREVRLNGSRCDESGGFFPLDDADPACPIPNRLHVAVDFQPLNRPDVAYVVYRTRSVPVATVDNPETDPPDLEARPVKFENGARDLTGTGVSVRSARVYVPYYPLPRRDCFAVLAIDEWGREIGSLENDACIDLSPLAPCPEGCDPAAMMCQTFPDPNPFESSPPSEGQSCENLGINGADPNRPVPPLEEGGGDGGLAGLADGGLPMGEDGVPGGGGDDGGGCSTQGSNQGPIFLAVCLVAIGWVRRRITH